MADIDDILNKDDVENAIDTIAEDVRSNFDDNVKREYRGNNGVND